MPSEFLIIHPYVIPLYDTSIESAAYNFTKLNKSENISNFIIKENNKNIYKKATVVYNNNNNFSIKISDIDFIEEYFNQYKPTNVIKLKL